MQQPGPATKGNRVRQLHISCGSSPLTQPLISLAAAVQSPYLYLPGISVLTSEEGEVCGYVKSVGSERSAFSFYTSQVHFTPCRLTFKDLLTLCMCRVSGLCPAKCTEAGVHILIIGYRICSFSNIQQLLSVYAFCYKTINPGEMGGQAIHFTATRADQTERATFPQGPSFEQDKHKACN